MWTPLCLVQPFLTCFPHTSHQDLTNPHHHRLSFSHGNTALWSPCCLNVVRPIQRADPVILPSPEGELACLIDADIDVNGTTVRVFVTHFGNEEDALDRKLQNEEVSRMATNSDPATPLIFLGYFTMKPGSELYGNFVRAGMADSAPQEQSRWCEYIWYRGLFIDEFKRVDNKLASDTEIQFASFHLPPRR
mmetsp:Transcript_36502/g.78903  ORF Transcript_36502/g.78903 Transcript_36502/m.78903 type:complete len:191 (-) Transcript_36502:80-652(-)